jgi:hypothetical protein
MTKARWIKLRQLVEKTEEASERMFSLELVIPRSLCPSEPCGHSFVRQILYFFSGV